MTLGGCIPSVPQPVAPGPPPLDRSGRQAPARAPAPLIADTSSPAPTSGTPARTAPAPTPTHASIPATAPASPIPSFDNWMDEPRTPGDWHYHDLPNSSYASFTSPAGRERFRFTCTASHTVMLTEPGRDPYARSMIIRTEFGDRTLPVSTASNNVRAVLTAHDDFLAKIAFSRGRFAVRVAGLPDLFLPSWPEITRVIEDCR